MQPARLHEPAGVARVARRGSGRSRMSNRKILLVEDNADLAHILPIHLQDLNCAVEVARTGDSGLELALAGDHDLILLDLVLPGIGGLEVCQRLRHERKHTPILMLTSKSAELDRVLGLEVGADDYLTKPFSIRELLARVKALLRRQELYRPGAAAAAPSVLVAGRLRVTVEARTVEVEGAPVELTAKEFDLLLHFARNPGRVFTRSQLLDSVWGYHHDGYEHTVNSHINRLRAKVEADPKRPDLILTVWGIGYKFASRKP
jgi:DNA-binding response OmpR family regulator